MPMSEGVADMLGCDKTVTITHLGYDGDTDQDTEQVQTFAGCSWYGQTKAAVTSNGLQSASVYKCRIPEEAAGSAPLVCARGDKITCGDVTATITAIHDNRGKPAPHWYVEAQ